MTEDAHITQGRKIEERSIRASIAMAVCNGERFIEAQIDSILAMMSPSDELIISYDTSTDSTLTIIKDYEKRDSRIYVYENNEKGISKNFQNALIHCSGEYIFLSDQDDIWINNKIEKCIEALEKSEINTLLVHNGINANTSLERIGVSFYSNGVFPKTSFIRIWVGKKNGYYLGCCFAFRKVMLQYFLPINFKSHDIWIACISSICGNIKFLDAELILHRLHDNNATPRKSRSIFIIIPERFLLLIKVFARAFCVFSKLK